MSKIIQVSQHTESLVKSSNWNWDYQYGYARSAESREMGEPGQDYIVFNIGKESISFVICDGISMSYYGDFAAKFLGDHLITWLSSLSETEQDVTELSDRLDQHLREITDEAKEKLRKHHIPPHIQGMLREVLLFKKEKGSSAIYGGGRIDLPCENFPEGRILLIWQGDIRFRLWTGRTEVIDKLGGGFRTDHQWNSEHGPIGGVPQVHCENLVDWGKSGAVLLYSDGLKVVDNVNEVSNEQLSVMLKNESYNPSSDDMSFFYVCWDLI